MLPFLQFLLIMAIIISFAKAGGFLSLRLGQPAVAGEVLAGLILGPTAINLLGWSFFTDIHLEETFTFLAELGVLLLMFIAGLEVRLSDLMKSGRAAILAGVLGFTAPMGFGFLIATFFGFAPIQGLFIGLLLAPTSVSISAQTLMELKSLRTRVGVTLLGAAVIDDTLVVLGVSFFLAVFAGSADTSSTFAIFSLVSRMVLYILTASFVGFRIIPRISRWIENLPISQGIVSVAFILMLFFAWSAEFLGGVATIIGAFIAGLSFARTPLKERILNGFSSIAYGIFVPIFFVAVGLEADLFSLDASNLLLLGALLLTAIVSKIFGSGLGGYIGKLSKKESVQLGFSMVPRGEVVLIVATVGITEGFITQAELSVSVGLVILTTLITPPILRILFRRTSDSPEQLSHDQA